MEFNSDTEQKIMRAATEVFLEKGKDGARMQQIADRAGINKALLHYYFRSKDKLFEQVFRQEFKFILSNIVQVLSITDDFKEFLRQFVRNYLQAIIPRRNLIRFIIWEIPKMQPHLVQYFFETFREHGYTENPVILRIKKAIDEGQIKSVDPIQFLMSFLGMCIFPIMAAPILQHILSEVDINHPDFIEQRVEGILDLVWNGIKP
jgi:TetR/AcrR family transcriptional regulator